MYCLCCMMLCSCMYFIMSWMCVLFSRLYLVFRLPCSLLCCGVCNVFGILSHIFCCILPYVLECLLSCPVRIALCVSCILCCACDEDDAFPAVFRWNSSCHWPGGAPQRTAWQESCTMPRQRRSLPCCLSGALHPTTIEEPSLCHPGAALPPTASEEPPLSSPHGKPSVQPASLASLLHTGPDEPISTLPL